MKTPRTTKAARKFTFTPTAWQWDPNSLQVDAGKRVQWWSTGGSCSLISLEEARKLVADRAAFCGASNYVCQVHEGIDGSNAS